MSGYLKTSVPTAIFMTFLHNHNKMNPLISIVIPAYQCERTLTKCVNSILSQTYGNREILIINDGSTDGTRRIAEEFAASYPDVRVINKPHNEGAAAARKTGLQHVNGDYFFSVDGDDYLEADALSILVNALGDNNVVIGEMRLESEREIPIWDTHCHFSVPPDSKEALFYNFLTKSIIGSLAGRLIRMDLAMSINEVPDSCTTGDDIIANLYMIRNNEVRIKIVDQIIYHYVQYPVSLTNGRNDATIRGRLNFIKLVINFFDNENLAASPLLSAAMSGFVPCEYFSYLRDGGGKRFDASFHKTVCSQFIKWRFIRRLPLWSIIILVIHKYCPAIGYLLSSIFAVIRKRFRYH